MSVVEHTDADAEFLFCYDWLMLTGDVYPTEDGVQAYWLAVGGLIQQAG